MLRNSEREKESLHELEVQQHVTIPWHCYLRSAIIVVLNLVIVRQNIIAAVLETLCCIGLQDSSFMSLFYDVYQYVYVGVLVFTSAVVSRVTLRCSYGS